MNFKPILKAVVLLLALNACSEKTPKNGLFELVDDSGIDFENKAIDQKDFNIFKYRNFYNGGGVAIGDINNDGLPDVFFTANMGSNKLYLNKGNFKFEDISVQAGFREKEEWSTGVTMVDINNDGWLDLYVCNAGHMMDPQKRKNQLFINNHQNRFSDSAAAYGLDNDGYTTHASFFDYDLDGDLDCFMVNNSPIPVNTLNYENARDVRAEDAPVKDFLKPGGDHLYRNDQGRFVEVSKEAGIHGSIISFGLGVTVGDVNGDRWPDVYVSNDFFERDYLYMNQQDGTFKDELENNIEHNSIAAMGTDMADINNDGFPDIFTTEMLPDDEYRLKTTTSFENIDIYRLKQKSGFHQQFMHNSLLLNNQNGRFKEISHFAGVEASDWSWGELMFDADNDGYTDIYVSNGIIRELTNQDFIDFFANYTIQKMVLTGKKEEIGSIIEKMPSHPIVNKMFHNQGNLKFEDKSQDWGLGIPSFSNGAAYGDLDNDGDLDMVVNNLNQPSFVFKNNSRQKNENHFLAVQLKGKGANHFALGSQVKLYLANGHVLTREMIPARGFQSSIDYKLIFGLGKQTTIDSLELVWPDRQVSTLYHPAVDTVLKLDAMNLPTKPFNPFVSGIQPLFKELEINLPEHRENDQVDFYAERMLPRLLSREGPAYAEGDLNGDGLKDIFLGASSKMGSIVFLQNKKGGFDSVPQPAFKAFVDREDVAATFFDADGDKDLDLFIGSGGNDRAPGSGELNHRLFLNDGKAKFSLWEAGFTPNDQNISIVVPLDYDNDGKLDLFVGARSVPFKYGQPPASSLYRNEGNGRFKDVTASIAPAFKTLGMVTAAVWAPVIKSQTMNLVVVGDWMYPKTFGYTNGSFTEIKTNLTTYYGWWQSIAAVDLDADGKQDLVLGNMGENGYLRPSLNAPVKLWLNDFDGNGSVDKVMTKTLHQKEMPVFLKVEMQEQMPLIKKQNLHYEEYAKKTFQELFPEDLRTKALQLTYNYCPSIIAWNQGLGNFEVQQLPQTVQFSCINAICTTDLNEDGLPDLLMGGNQFGFLPQFGRLDANYGSVLINKGKRKMDILTDVQTGLSVRGETRHIGQLGDSKNPRYIFIRNNCKPVLIALQKQNLLNLHEKHN